MPTYDYQCKKCGHEFEVFHKMSDKPIDKCPKCQGKVEKMIGGGAGLIFKGSGFFLTDYKKSNVSSNNKNDSGAKNCACCDKSKSCPSAKKD